MVNSTRAIVIEDSVYLEGIVSIYLCYLMDVVPDETKLFGETSAALPFNAKINLLIEFQFLTKELADKFIKYSEIRNKFAHLRSVVSFVTCFDKIEGLEKKLIKWFPDSKKSEDREETLKTLYSNLFTDLKNSMELYHKKIYEDTRKRTYELHSLRIYDLLLQRLSKRGKTDPDFQEYINSTLDEVIAEAKAMPPHPDPKYLKYLKKNFPNPEH